MNLEHEGLCGLTSREFGRSVSQIVSKVICHAVCEQHLASVSGCRTNPTQPMKMLLKTLQSWKFSLSKGRDHHTLKRYVTCEVLNSQIVCFVPLKNLQVMHRVIHC